MRTPRIFRELMELKNGRKKNKKAKDLKIS